MWIPKILAQIEFYVVTWKFCHDRVFNLHRRSQLQHEVVYCDLFPMLLLGFHRERVSMVPKVFFSSAYSFCRDRSFFGPFTICLAKSVVLIVPCHDNLICGSLNSYVATSTILLRQSFCAASSNWCREPVFMPCQHFCFGSCCNNVSCIVIIFVAT